MQHGSRTPGIPPSQSHHLPPLSSLYPQYHLSLLLSPLDLTVPKKQAIQRVLIPSLKQALVGPHVGGSRLTQVGLCHRAVFPYPVKTASNLLDE